MFGFAVNLVDVAKMLQLPVTSNHMTSLSIDSINIFNIYFHRGFPSVDNDLTRQRGVGLLGGEWVNNSMCETHTHAHLF